MLQGRARGVNFRGYFLGKGLDEFEASQNLKHLKSDCAYIGGEIRKRRSTGLKFPAALHERSNVCPEKGRCRVPLSVCGSGGDIDR